MGPQVNKIIGKSLTVFPKLDSLGLDDVVNFYDCLQEVSMNCALTIMPFNPFVLSNHVEGFCPPGMGLHWYAAMCKALMELLPWLIPGSVSSQVNAALASVCYERGNGYNYLWRLLELMVPGFDQTICIEPPHWLEVTDIFQFVQDYLLFFRLQAKLNFHHYDDCTRSGIFLHVVRSSQYADTVTLLQSHIGSYWQKFEDTSPLTSGYTAWPTASIRTPRHALVVSPTVTLTVSLATLHSFRGFPLHTVPIHTECTMTAPMVVPVILGPVNGGIPMVGVAMTLCPVGVVRAKLLANLAMVTHRMVVVSTTAAPANHATPVTMADPGAPTVLLGPTAIAAPSSRVFNAPHAAALATWLNSATCLPQLFVSSAT